MRDRLLALCYVEEASTYSCSQLGNTLATIVSSISCPLLPAPLLRFSYISARGFYMSLNYPCYLLGL